MSKRATLLSLTPHNPPTQIPGSWWRARVWIFDLVVVLAVFAYNLPILPISVPEGPRLAALVVVSVGLCGPYLFRRRYPLITFGAIFIAACVQLPFGSVLIAADVMLLFAVFNLATRYRWQISFLCAMVVVAWLLVAVVPKMDEAFIDIGQLGVLLILILLVWTWGTLVRIRGEYITSLHEQAQQLKREQQALAHIAAAEERSRIAREIHDIVSHGLSVMVVMSDGAASKVDSEPTRAKSAMVTVRDTGRTALAEMRRMLGVLRETEPGSHAPQPGIAQLDQLVEESKAAGLPVTMVMRGEPIDPPAGVDVAVYRIAQEALTNVRKHAGPSVETVQVQLSYEADKLVLRVIDNGQGFASHSDKPAGGHGLIGMKERVAACDGTLRAGMRPSGGFEVVAVLPIGRDR